MSALDAREAAERIMAAAGTKLGHYMPGSQAKIIQAMQAVLDETAAPDLLEAAKEAHQAIETRRGSLTGTEVVAIARLTAAIAKAEGRS